MLGWFKKSETSAQEKDPVQQEPKSETVEVQEVPKTSEVTELKEDEPRGSGLFDSYIDDDELKEPEVEQTESEEVEIPQPQVTEESEEEITPSFFGRLTKKLSRTRDSFVHQMDSLFLGKKEIDSELLDDLEELLITSDIGVNTTTELIEYARKKVKRKELSDPLSLKSLIKEKLRTYIVDATRPAELVMPESGPFIIMVVGVNGVGKTTTIGKITHKFINSGQSVLLAAADTFRAAAVSQLKIWGERNGVEVVSKEEGADPSAVAFDAVKKAISDNYDVLLVDTAGRLHTQTNLMEELKKIKRVMAKQLETAPHEVLLVIDATTGQNGISQAKLFNEAVGVSGLALTKLDGTAKGGIIANICHIMNIPIRFIGIGEKVEDLRDFDPDEFIEALFQNKEIQ